MVFFDNKLMTYMRLNHKNFLYNNLKTRLYKYKEKYFKMENILLHFSTKKKLILIEQRRLFFFLSIIINGKVGKLKKNISSKIIFFGKLVQKSLSKFLQKTLLFILPNLNNLNSFLNGKNVYNTEITLNSFLDIRIIPENLNSIKLSLFFNSSVNNRYEFMLLLTEFFWPALQNNKLK